VGSDGDPLEVALSNVIEQGVEDFVSRLEENVDYRIAVRSMASDCRGSGLPKCHEFFDFTKAAQRLLGRYHAIAVGGSTIVDVLQDAMSEPLFTNECYFAPGPSYEELHRAVVDRDASGTDAEK